jgi:hypothetical protein
VTFLSKIERANEEMRRTSARRTDRVTPLHAAAQVGLAADGEGAETAGEVAEPDVTKAFRDAVCPPADFPQPVRVSPEDFRRGPVLPGHDALSPGYEPALSFPVQPAGSFRGPDSAASYVNGDCA